MMNYPVKLDSIFNKLRQNGMKPIIIGGYVRDKILNVNSKDIDIEVYGVDSLQKLEKILREFGDVNSVGKSFGVCKLKYEELDLDFSLPREDSKISSGHRGFEIKTDSQLDFTTATSRRDFTMNAIGYDIVEQRLLDPFHGVKDIKHQVIRAVNLSKFGEDPLRVLRAVQFASRFHFKLDDALFEKCKNMVASQALEELPKERIFGELKKLLLKSPKPSDGILLLKAFHSTLYFDAFEEMLDALDYFAGKNIKDSDIKLTLMLVLLSYKLQEEQSSTFLSLLTEKKELHKEVLSLLKNKETLNIYKYNDYDLYRLATHVNIKKFLYMIDALTLGKEAARIKSIEQRAQKLNILHTKAEALIQGRDLIKLGYKPSPRFSTLLDKVYDAQLRCEFTTYTEAVEWIKTHLRR